MLPVNVRTKFDSTEAAGNECLHFPGTHCLAYTAESSTYLGVKYLRCVSAGVLEGIFISQW